MAMRNRTVRTKRASVSLFGKFIQKSSDSAATITGVGDGKPDNLKVLKGSWFGNQIVIGMGDDLHTREVARPQLAAHINAAINVRRVGFTAGNKVAASGRW